jgi:membrane protease YdiL (CAAX protease family)
MSLHRRHTPLIQQGWLRALLLVAAYSGVTFLGSYLVPALEVWLALAFLLSILLVYIFRKYIDRRSFSSLGLHFSSLYPDAITGFALGTFLVICGAVIIYLLKGLEWIDIVSNSEELFLSSVLLIMIAFSEELVFRGYVLHNLIKSFNKWLALLISAILFTLLHSSNAGIPALGLVNTFFGGIVAGLTYIYTRNLWLPVFFHFSWNFVQGPVVGFAVSGLPFYSVLVMETNGSDSISGGKYGYEGSFICTIMLLVAVAVFIYLEHRKTMTMTAR